MLAMSFCFSSLHLVQEIVVESQSTAFGPTFHAPAGAVQCQGHPKHVEVPGRSRGRSTQEFLTSSQLAVDL